MKKLRLQGAQGHKGAESGGTQVSLTSWASALPVPECQPHWWCIRPFQGTVQAEAAVHAPEPLVGAGLLGHLPSLGILLTWDFPLMAFLQLLLPLSCFLEDPAMRKECPQPG